MKFGIKRYQDYTEHGGSVCFYIKTLILNSVLTRVKWELAKGYYRKFIDFEIIFPTNLGGSQSEFWVKNYEENAKLVCFDSFIEGLRVRIKKA